MIIIDSNSKYLAPEIMEQCFESNKTLTTDKQVCGNGASTSFFKMVPQEGKKNILIAPNKQFLINKQAQYDAGSMDTDNRIKFFYKEGTDSTFDDAEVLVFVADSFMLKEDAIRKLDVDKVMIDEIHTSEKDSSFRFVLKDFVNKVENIVSTEGRAITCITASPLAFSKVDIKINNTLREDILIHFSRNRVEGIGRIKSLIKKGERVVVFTTNSTTVQGILESKNFKRDKKQTLVNWMVGDSMRKSLAPLVDIKQDDNSKLIIVSSRGFEGIDIADVNNEKWNVFFFEDRANEYESFYLSNLYQAINRPREGAKYIEYNRQERIELSKGVDVEGLDKYINRTDISVEKKMSNHYSNDYEGFYDKELKGSKEFKQYHPYVIFEAREETFTIKKDEVSVNLQREKALYDRYFLQIINDEDSPFAEFIADRKISFKFLNDDQKRYSRYPKDAHKEFMLKHNAEVIAEEDLFGNMYYMVGDDRKHYKKVVGKDNDFVRKFYLREFNKWLMRKNYNGAYKMTETQEMVLGYLSSKVMFKELLSVITNDYRVRSVEKYGKGESRSYIKSFREQGAIFQGSWLLTLCNNRVNVSKKIVANRDYNISVQRSLGAIETIAGAVGVKVTELDIVSAFPKLLYAINGLQLPEDFYGKDKVNKKAISTIMNNFYYKADAKKEYRNQKYEKQLELSKYFHPKVVSYMMDKHFNSGNRGSLFNELAYYERDLLKEVSKHLNLEDSGALNRGVVRRHDSLLLFDNAQDLESLNDFTYKGFINWFKEQEPMLAELKWRSDSHIEEHGEVESWLCA